MKEHKYHCTTTRDSAARGAVHVAGFCCALGYILLAIVARQPGEPALPLYFFLVVWTALPTFALFLHGRQRGHAVSVGQLFLWAVVFRLCGLAGGPFFEDDHFRYLWDGFRFATAGTPYGVAPEAFFVDATVPAIFHPILDQINNPDLTTIYGPTTQIVFLVAYWLQPASAAALQSILIVVDLVVIALLLRLAPARNVMLYAWCPLVVKEVAFTAHPEGIGICLLLAAVVLAKHGHWRRTALCLGLAVGAKIFALLLAPLILLRARPGVWLLFGSTLAALYAPFLLMGGTDLESLGVFAREWEFNSAAFGLLTAVMEQTTARVVLALVFTAFWATCAVRLLRTPGHVVPRGDWIYGAFLTVSPVINPWYLLWLLPFATIRPSAWAWTASVAVLLGYASGINIPNSDIHPFAQPTWVRVLEFGAILCALAYDLLRRRRANLASEA